MVENRLITRLNPSILGPEFPLAVVTFVCFVAFSPHAFVLTSHAKDGACVRERRSDKVGAANAGTTFLIVAEQRRARGYDPAEFIQ